MDNFEVEPKKKRLRKTYTKEQKLVATVWYHERLYTGLTLDQLAANFKFRFNTKMPKRYTLTQWEEKLFKTGFASKNKPRTTLTRLIYVPYVKESLVRFPDLAPKARAQMLGISWDSLNCILKYDLPQNSSTTIKEESLPNVQDNTNDSVADDGEESSSQGSNYENSSDVKVFADSIKNERLDETEVNN